MFQNPSLPSEPSLSASCITATNGGRRLAWASGAVRGLLHNIPRPLSAQQKPHTHVTILRLPIAQDLVRWHACVLTMSKLTLK